MVCVAWHTLVTNTKPFEDNADDRLAQIEGLQVLFTLLIGLVLQLQEAQKVAGTASEDDQTVLSGILIGLTCAVFVVVALQHPHAIYVYRFGRTVCTKLAACCCCCCSANHSSLNALKSETTAKVAPMPDAHAIVDISEASVDLKKSDTDILAHTGSPQRLSG